MKNWNKICGFLAIFFLSVLFSSAQGSKNIFHLTKIPAISPGNFFVNAPPYPISSYSLMIIRPDHYTKHFGFFCKQELVVEKALKIPFRFRLGSMEQCNYLEGKGR